MMDSTIAIIDYGMGNLRSVQKALEAVGAKTKITHSPTDITQAAKVVLPGVGAMQPAMKRLNELGLIGVVRKVAEDNKPFLGICLGLQLLFDRSSEGGASEGLRIISGSVDRFTSLKVPHMGWNQIAIQSAGQKMAQGLNTGENVYFCHSYYVKPQDPAVIAMTTDYGVSFVSAIAKGRVWGVQFHPEKSQHVGLTILKNFVNL